MITNKDLFRVNEWINRISAGSNYKLYIDPIYAEKDILKIFVHYYYSRTDPKEYISDVRLITKYNITHGIEHFAELVYYLIQEITIHEMNEQFTIDKKRVMNPHFTGYTKLE